MFEKCEYLFDSKMFEETKLSELVFLPNKESWKMFRIVILYKNKLLRVIMHLISLTWIFPPFYVS